MLTPALWNAQFGERTRVMLAVLFAADNDSHDRDLLDGVCDHVLVLNRSTIEVQAGNFTTWWENKEKKDAFLQAENEKHLKSNT